MRYMGGKHKISKKILPIILADRASGSVYVEPFLGGANTFWEVSGPKIANDIRAALVAMWKAVAGGWVPPDMDEALYRRIKSDPDAYPQELVGFASSCSFGGKPWAGFFKPDGTGRDYVQEVRRAILKQASGLSDTVWYAGDYQDFYIPPGSTVYCDPPYASTTQYDNWI